MALRQIQTVTARLRNDCSDRGRACTSAVVRGNRRVHQAISLWVPACPSGPPQRARTTLRSMPTTANPRFTIHERTSAGALVERPTKQTLGRQDVVRVCLTWANGSDPRVRRNFSRYPTQRCEVGYSALV